MADQTTRDAYHEAMNRLYHLLSAMEHLEQIMMSLESVKENLLSDLRKLEVQVTGD